jgi:hypothetical protein
MALGCTIAVIYDQSPQGNHLRAAPARRGSIDLEVGLYRSVTFAKHLCIG